MIIDIFTYSQATSHAAFSVDVLVNAARDAHLDGICVTDRAVSYHLRDLAAYGAKENFFVGVGIELETNIGRVVVYPRVIDDEFVSESWRCLGESPDIVDVLNYFHERQAIVIARDVYNNGEGMRDRIYCAKDANGRCVDGVDTLAVYRRRIDNELAISAQQALKVPACAGSGVFDDISDIGYCATLFAESIHDQAEFVDAMLNRSHWACSLRDVGEASPMGSAPREENDDRGDRGDRHFGHDRGDRRDGERRYGRERGDRGDRRDDRRRGDRRDGDRRHSDHHGPRRPRV